MRLLPDRPEIGWTPYVWLIYLVQILIGLGFKGAGELEWALNVLGMAVFLVLYFRGFWLDGRRLVPVILGIALLGVVFSPLNWAAVVYFIYAGAFCAHVGPPRVAWRWLAALTLLLTAEAAVFELPAQGWIPGVIFIVLIGAINIYYRDRERINVKLKLAQEEVERLAKVAERERIARDLHDVLGHSLSLLTLKSELAARLVREQPERAEREMREVERISRETLAQVREAVRGYRLAGLAAELANARLACEAAGVTLLVEQQAAPLSAEREHALALALREAVTNVIRHAQASTCRVRLGPAGDRYELEVEDDGRGSLSREGAGLTGMRERAAALGGAVTWNTDEGTRLLVSLPRLAAEPGRPEAVRSVPA